MLDGSPTRFGDSPEAIAHVAQRRQGHEAEQPNLAGIAAAIPGAGPCINVPWPDEMAMATFVQLSTARRTQQRQASLLGDNLSALTFCKPGRFDARSEKHTRKYYGSVQCARQRSIPGHVLYNK